MAAPKALRLDTIWEVTLGNDFARDSDTVKALFDHFRNVAICGAVAAGGVWSLKQAGQYGPFTSIMSFVGGLALVFFAILLFASVTHSARGQTSFGVPDCGQWVEQSSGTTRAWLLGYLSGMNAIHVICKKNDPLDRLGSDEHKDTHAGLSMFTDLAYK